MSYGLEQLVFPEGLPPRPRSYHSFEQCLGDLPKNARLLDYGAGDGAVLKSASKLLPGWKLDAFDISDSYKSEIQAIAGVENFYSNDRNQIEKKKYDLVVLWHTLEHVPSPTDELLLVKEFVRDSGLLFVQVPDVERNPFDMGVYDHVSHFSKTTLIRCAERAGWRVKKDGCTWTHNCLTILFEMTNLCEQTGQSNVGNSLLSDLNNRFARMNSEIGNRKYSIWGTGTASLLISGHMSSPPDYFIDEDSSRSHGHVDGVEILTPEQVEPQKIVLLPFPKETAQKIEQKARRLDAIFGSTVFIS